jgi:hypothetical protein
VVLWEIQCIRIHFAELNIRESQLRGPLSPQGEHLRGKISSHDKASGSDLPSGGYGWFPNARRDIEYAMAWLNAGQLHQTIADLLR